MEELKIDKETYQLTEKNYIKKENKKSQIVLGNSFSSNMLHYTGWLKRHCGNFKKTSAFTIDINGNIIQHFDPKYYSDFISIKGTNEKIISITLENIGWLNCDMIGKYYDRYNNEYKGKIIEKGWRNHNYWATYNTKQMDSTVKLCKNLCEEFNIERECISYNTKSDDVYEFEGVCFRSNYLKHYSDISPAFDISKFDAKLTL